MRLSVFDTLPYQTSREIGQPMPYEHLLPYEYGFGVKPDIAAGDRPDASRFELLRVLQPAGVAAVNLSCGSPYYNPHIQRPAIFPPSDGYQPPEDPLVGVVPADPRRAAAARRPCPSCRWSAPATRTCRTTCRTSRRPSCATAGSTSSAWAAWCCPIPSCPPTRSPPADSQRKHVCRTFSDCTTAPRNGLISGCYPLDPYYKALPEAEQVKEIKQELKAE